MAYVALGRRRATRALRWFGDGTVARLPGAGRETVLQRNMALAWHKPGAWTLRGPEDSLAYFCRVLAEQERVERAAAQDGAQ